VLRALHVSTSALWQRSLKNLRDKGVIMKKLENKSADVEILQQLLSVDNDQNIVLFDEEGNTVELEQIAVVTKDDALYAILRHLEDEEDEVLVYKVDTTDEEVLTQVQDEKLALEIIELYNSEQK